MAVRDRRAVRAFVTYTVATLLIAGTTWGLHAFQNWLAHKEQVETVRAFSIGYLLPLALITLWAGRVLGIYSLVLALLLSVLVLMFPRWEVRVSYPADMASLLFLLLTGGLVIAAIDAAQRNVRLRRQAQARARREALLARIARSARGSGPPDAVQRLAAEAVAQELGADRAYVVVYDYLRQITQVTDEWHRPGLPPMAGQYPIPSDTPLLESYQRGETLVAADTAREPLLAPAREALAARRVRSLIHVPLGTEGRVQAVFAAAMADEPRDWAATDVEFVELVAAETRAAAEAGRMLAREQTVSRALQDAILPAPRRDVPGLDVATHYRAALAEATIGGDFCDVFPLGGSAWALVVGDVSGKGLKAAAQIGVTRNMLRYVLYQRGDQGKCLGECLAELNAVLTRHDLLTGFVTLFVGVYDVAAATLTYVSCGHEPALLRREGGVTEPLPPGGPVLGVIPDACYVQAVRTLSPGDALLIYTDGASEAGPDREHQLGLSGLCGLLERHAPGQGDAAEALVAALAADIGAFAGGALHDDLCLLAAVRRG